MITNISWYFNSFLLRNLSIFDYILVIKVGKRFFCCIYFRKKELCRYIVNEENICRTIPDNVHVFKKSLDMAETTQTYKTCSPQMFLQAEVVCVLIECG